MDESARLKNAPKLFYGAIIILNAGGNRDVIRFQYNPSTMSRTLASQNSNSSGSGKEKSQLLMGAPTETISLTIAIDAADQLGIAQTNALKDGIYPQLSALEVLMYPKSVEVEENKKSLEKGALEIVPKPPSLVLFNWGERKVPVKIESFSITEKSYDVKLNPILAEVSLTLKVLSYNDFKLGEKGYSLFAQYQKAKENMADKYKKNSQAINQPSK